MDLPCFGDELWTTILFLIFTWWNMFSYSTWYFSIAMFECRRGNMVIFHVSFRLLASECLGLRTAEPSGSKQPSVIRNCPSTRQYDQYAKECIHLWLNPCLSLFISLSLLFRLVEPNQTKQLWHTNIIGVYPIFEINWLRPQYWIPQIWAPT
jgi:hypothetical protein